jgi:carotenoid cleavage dioxygenase-like enzyme
MPNKSSFSYGAGFRSLTREIREPVALPVEGKLPSSLKSTLLRTGPANFEVGSRIQLYLARLRSSAPVTPTG